MNKFTVTPLNVYDTIVAYASMVAVTYGDKAEVFRISHIYPNKRGLDAPTCMSYILDSASRANNTVLDFLCDIGEDSVNDASEESLEFAKHELERCIECKAKLHRLFDDATIDMLNTLISSI